MADVTKFKCAECKQPVYDTRELVPNHLCNECDPDGFKFVEPVTTLESPERLYGQSARDGFKREQDQKTISEMLDDERQLAFEV